MFGGMDHTTGHTNRLDIADLSSDPVIWTQPTTTGELPSPRRLHTATLDSVGHMHVLGGGSIDELGHRIYMGDHIVLDIDQLQWHVEPAPVEWSYMGHSCVRFLENVKATRTGTVPTDPMLWQAVSNGDTGNSSSTSGVAVGPEAVGREPRSRSSPSSSSDSSTGRPLGEALAVFGGMKTRLGVPPNLEELITNADLQVNLPSATDDLLIYDIDRGLWRRVEPRGEPPTRGKFRHSATIVRSHLMVIFGGLR